MSTLTKTPPATPRGKRPAARKLESPAKRMSPTKNRRSVNTPPKGADWRIATSDNSSSSSSSPDLSPSKNNTASRIGRSSGSLSGTSSLPQPSPGSGATRPSQSNDERQRPRAAIIEMMDRVCARTLEENEKWLASRGYRPLPESTSVYAPLDAEFELNWGLSDGDDDDDDEEEEVEESNDNKSTPSSLTKSLL